MVSTDGGGDFTSIAAAVATSGEHDVIRVLDGTYFECGFTLKGSRQLVGNFRVPDPNPDEEPNEVYPGRDRTLGFDWDELGDYGRPHVFVTGPIRVADTAMIRGLCISDEVLEGREPWSDDEADQEVLRVEGGSPEIVNIEVDGYAHSSLAVVGSSTPLIRRLVTIGSCWWDDNSSGRLIQSHTGPITFASLAHPIVDQATIGPALVGEGAYPTIERSRVDGRNCWVGLDGSGEHSRVTVRQCEIVGGAVGAGFAHGATGTIEDCDIFAVWTPMRLIAEPELARRYPEVERWVEEHPFRARLAGIPTDLVPADFDPSLIAAVGTLNEGTAPVFRRCRLYGPRPLRDESGSTPSLDDVKWLEGVVHPFTRIPEALRPRAALATVSSPPLRGNFEPSHPLPRAIVDAPARSPYTQSLGNRSEFPGGL